MLRADDVGKANSLPSQRQVQSEKIEQRDAELSRAPVLVKRLSGRQALGASASAGVFLASATSRIIFILALQSFAPATWPVLKAAGLVWLLPWRRRLKLSKPVAMLGTAFCPPILILWLVSVLLRHLAPDSSRTCRFWNRYLPIHVRYTYTKLRYSEQRGYSRQEVEEAWHRRHDWGAGKVSDLLQDLSGYYVKSAQIMASKTDFLPQQWTQQLTPIFFDNMEPREWKVLHRSLKSFLGETSLAKQIAADMLGSAEAVEKIFGSCESTCLASASIAQVHAATLSKATLDALGTAWQQGPEVVLKIQHLDMQALMESDIRNLRRLCAFVRDVLPYDPTPMLDEMRDTVGKEFNFVREARLMRVIASRMEHDNPGIRIPQPIMQLTTPDLLVMQRMSGIPFSKILEGGEPELRARAAAAVPKLLHCYGRMMFRHGLFHADAHAGNLMLQEDGDLVLLDFGQCKALPLNRHRALARLIIAMDDDDPLAIALGMSGMDFDFLSLEGGIPDPAIVRIVAFIIFDTRPLPEALINPLADDAVIKKIPLQKAPEDLFSLGRTIMLLRGLCFSLGLDIQAAKIWRPYAEAALRDPELPKLAAANQQHDLGY